MISVVIPAHNASSTLLACISAISASSYRDYEVIVVDDCSTDSSPIIAQNFATKLISLKDGPYGPAYARNQGALYAQGDVLLFIDADVVMYPDTLKKISQVLEISDDYAALFGSYDDAPGDGGFFSQYKNLTHAYIHQKASPEGSTFWSGCGAIQKEVFTQLGGFDVARYPKPSIEDIELGSRLTLAGYRILVDKGVKVKHLKRWTFTSLIKTDIFNRAIPWTLLILRNKNMPNDLNLGQTQRISALLSVIFLVTTLALVFVNGVVLYPLFLVMFLRMVNDWNWDKGKSQIHAKLTQILTTTGIIIGSAIVAWLSGNPNLAIILSALAIFEIGLLFFRKANFQLQKIYYKVLGFLLLLAFLSLILSIPVLYSLPATIFLAAVLLLNHNLFRYLRSRNGILFSLAALPMQVLYYIYSLVSLVFGVFIHVWTTVLRPKISFRQTS